MNLSANLRATRRLDPPKRLPGRRVVVDMRNVQVVFPGPLDWAVPDNPELLQERAVDLPVEINVLGMTQDRAGANVVLSAGCDLVILAEPSRSAIVSSPSGAEYFTRQDPSGSQPAISYPVRHRPAAKFPDVPSGRITAISPLACGPCSGSSHSKSVHSGGLRLRFPR